MTDSDTVRPYLFKSDVEIIIDALHLLLGAEGIGKSGLNEYGLKIDELFHRLQPLTE